MYAVLSALFTLLLTRVIDPEYIETASVLYEENLLNGGRPQAQVDMLMEIFPMLFHPVSQFFSMLFVSAIVVLITSAIAKKVNTNPFAGSENI